MSLLDLLHLNRPIKGVRRPDSQGDIKPLGGAVTRKVDPHVELSSSATSLKVGETITLRGKAVDIGMPFFQLSVRDSGSASFVPLARVTYDNKLTRPSMGTSGVLEVVSASGDMENVEITLRARAKGAVDVVIGATGEIHYGYPGPATWAGGGSDKLKIKVC